jgi:predicted aminopeptidase
MSSRLLFLIILLTLSGCAKLGYLTEQGYQQVRIQWIADRDNDDVLDDPKVPQEVKEKIILVGEYKKFFYHHFNEKPTGIYTKTTMLDSEAVSYLVIASEHTKIEAHEFHFPILGDFPYIGFFKESSAKKFARNLQEDENLVTYIRPVYAYSTLGYLEDRILSSFFEYDEFELAELVFHELFHTIFFIKNEVDLNENLANLYGKELLQEYFKDQDQLKAYLEREDRKEQMSKRVVELIAILQAEFQKLGGFLTNDKADELTQRFVDEVFKPDLRRMCNDFKLSEKDCEFKRPWNQAAFAAFLTYEEDQDFLQDLRKNLKLDLRGFLSWIRAQYKDFDNQKKIDNFTDYLKSKVPHAPTAAD